MHFDGVLAAMLAAEASREDVPTAAVTAPPPTNAAARDAATQPRTPRRIGRRLPSVNNPVEIDENSLQPQIALWGLYDLNSYGHCLDARIFEHELRRRLPDANVDLFAPVAATLSPRSHRPAARLGRWTRQRRAVFAERYDLIAIGGDVVHNRAEPYQRVYGGLRERVVDDPRRFFVEGLGINSQVPVVWHAIGAPFELEHKERDLVEAALRTKAHATVRDPASADRLAFGERELPVVGHPGLLVRRLVPEEVRERRLEYLRRLDSYPPRERPLVIEFPAVPDAPGHAGLGGDVPVVLVDLGDAPRAAPLTETASYRLGEDASIEDLVAAIAGARAFIGSSVAGRAAASAYGVPTWEPAELERPEEVARLLAQTDPEPSVFDTSALDTHFDTLAALAEHAWRARLGRAPDAPAIAAAAVRARADAEERGRLLLTAHEARTAQLLRERLRAAELLDALEDPEAEGELAKLRIENAELTNRVQVLDATGAALRDELRSLGAVRDL